jgi:hypothetical protein
VKKILLLSAAVAFAFAAFIFLRLPHIQKPPSATQYLHEGPATMVAPSAHPLSVNPAEVSVPATSAHDRAQADTLEKILASHNDNDMRLDTELKLLNAGAKELFRQKYEQLAPEKRNERGTIVFLLGRNLTQERDLAFMSKVLAEPPCRSMQNCASDPPPSRDVHGDNAVDVSLAYPPIVALKSLERVLGGGRGSPGFERALEIVHTATQSPVTIVANLAHALEARYERH